MNECDNCKGEITEEETCWYMATPMCHGCFLFGFADYPCEHGHFDCATEPRGECSNARFATQTLETVR